MWRSLIFEKRIFPAENAGNMPEKSVFWPFLEIISLVFFQFFAQRCILAMLILWPSPIFDKNLFPAKNAENMLEIAVPADFIWTFSTYFVFHFHTKALMILFLRSFVRSLVRSFVRSFARSFVCSFTRSFAAFFRTFISREVQSACCLSLWKTHFSGRKYWKYAKNHHFSQKWIYLPPVQETLTGELDFMRVHIFFKLPESRQIFQCGNQVRFFIADQTEASKQTCRTVM